MFFVSVFLTACGDHHVVNDNITNKPKTSNIHNCKMYKVNQEDKNSPWGLKCENFKSPLVFYVD